MPERKSLAVLPFAAVAGDPKMTAFGKGLLEDVAAKLSQLSANHDLEVVPARTLEEKKGHNLADAKKEFGVNLGLTVSIEQAGDLVRAAYSLTDAKSGKNLAGAQITAPVSDIFTIEDKWQTAWLRRCRFRSAAKRSRRLGRTPPASPRPTSISCRGAVICRTRASRKT